MSSFGDSRRSDETTRGPSTVGRGGPGSCRRVTHQSVRFCETRDGVRIAYATSGHGPPLVRVATWLTTLELDWECAVCRPWLSELSLEHTLVRFDPRGSGLSQRQVERLSLADWVADLEAVTDAAGIRRFPLLGVGHGAAIALAFAASHPERVERLVLFGSSVRGAFTPGADPKMRREAQVVQQLLELGWSHEAPALRGAFARLYVPETSHERAIELGELQRSTADKQQASRLWHALNSVDVSAAARRVRCPTLVVHVGDDAVVPPEQGREMAALVPDARLLTLDGPNHILLEDEPAWKEFLVELRRFLRESVTGAANGPPAGAVAGTLAELTRREHEVLELIARGYDNGTIAVVLDRSPKTVRNHITSIFAKLDVGRRAQAIVMARDAGLGVGQRAKAA